MEACLELADDAAARRGEARRKLYLAAAIGRAHATSSVDILNLSASGMLLQTTGSLALDEPLTIVAPEFGARQAGVVWASGTLYGCRFEKALTKGELSAIELRSRPAAPLPVLPREGGGDSFAARLKRLRVQSGLSMDQFAERLGVTKPTLWKWETQRAQPRAKALRRIAAILPEAERDSLFRMPAAPETGNRAAPGHTGPGKTTVCLVDMIARSRAEIAELAGVAPEKVSIVISWT